MITPVFKLTAEDHAKLVGILRWFCSAPSGFEIGDEFNERYEEVWRGLIDPSETYNDPTVDLGIHLDFLSVRVVDGKDVLTVHCILEDEDENEQDALAVDVIIEG